MDDTRLKAMRARLAAATPGPWEARHEQAASGIFAPSESTKLSMHGRARIGFTGGLVIHNHEADAAFIAAARQDVPDLLAFVEAALPILRAVASTSAPRGSGFCAFCGGTCQPTRTAPYKWRMSDDFAHTADCPVTQARALLAGMDERADGGG